MQPIFLKSCAVQICRINKESLHPSFNHMHYGKGPEGKEIEALQHYMRCPKFLKWAHSWAQNNTDKMLWISLKESLLICELQSPLGISFCEAMRCVCFSPLRLHLGCNGKRLVLWHLTWVGVSACAECQLHSRAVRSSLWLTHCLGSTSPPDKQQLHEKKL